MKHKQRSIDYEETRKKILLEDIDQDERIINRLNKKLGLKRRKKEGKSIVSHPLWMRETGFDYLLDFEQEVEKVKPNQTVTLLVGKKRKRKAVDAFGDELAKEADLSNPACHEEISMSLQHDETPTDVGLERIVRNFLNQLSESNLHRVVTELTGLFFLHPRAAVRSTLVDQMFALLQVTPVGSGSLLGWLQQELAVCLACVHIQLQLKQKQPHLTAFMVEKILKHMENNNETASSSNHSSHLLFLSCLYRFHVLTHDLVFDLLCDFVRSEKIEMITAAHQTTKVVGVYLRRADVDRCKEVVETCKKQLVELKENDIELRCELQGIISCLTEKRSNEPCVARCARLRKLMATLIKTSFSTEDLCAPLRLADFRNAGNSGRWWMVGSALSAAADNPMQVATNSSVELNPAVEEAAYRLGLKTSLRRELFTVVVDTGGGPDATASALAKACCTGTTSAATSSAKEREAVQLLVHCLISEPTFNRFYPRVLGGLLNHHRRFTMMTKCAYWDVLNRENLIVSAKSNAGRSAGLLALVYDFPLSFLKQYNFGDESEGNVAFLSSLVRELCTGEYQKVLSKLLQLTSYTRLSRNFRLFLRKHFTEEPDLSLRSYVNKLISDLRDGESF